jgi:hypothetical protein
MSGTNTRLSVAYRLVRARELSEVVASHLRLDFNGVEDLYGCIRKKGQHKYSKRVRYLHVDEERHIMLKPTHLAVVDTDYGANHLWYDNHVAEVGLDDSRFLIRRRLLLRLAQFLDQTHRATFQAALEPSPCTSVNQLYTEIQQ